MSTNENDLLPMGAHAEMRKAYEAARAKDAELIQMLVNDLSRAYCIDSPSLVAAQAAGFTPSNK